ncbi:MAG: hypothetical protein E7138_02025 [Rikenellaceae bacterium]|jgi:hypothetical protein|nr:hypothetical protein [Rikenellaceae bacterium]
MIAKRTKIVELTFTRQNLLYDIENYAFVEGDVMRTDNEHAKHQVFDIAQDGNIDRVNRILDLAHAECVEMMYPYTKEPCDSEEVQDNSLSVKEQYQISMLVPDDFSKSTVSLITKLVHEYMVCRVLADWMSITNPSSQSNWQSKLDSIEEQIRNHLNARCGRVRRAQTPF